MTGSDLLNQFYEWASGCIDEEGFGVAKALIRMADGGVAVAVLDLPPHQAYQHLLRVWTAEEPPEIVFAIDRYAAPNQGTAMNDLVAGWHFTRARPVPFIIEYQHAPRIVGPIDYDNVWWNAALARELTSHLRSQLGLSGAWTTGR
jgi:hypothetical protein